MRILSLLTLALMLGANPITLLDEQSGFYKNNTKKMLALYETNSTQNVINQIPLDAICIIALERHKNGKMRIDYKGQQGWVDVSKNPDAITLMSYEEMQIPMVYACSQVGSYFFEVQSIQEGKPIKVYKKPSTKSKVITTLPDHESCLINLGCEWPWCHVDYGDGSGWVLSINLSDKIQNVDGYCIPRKKGLNIN